MTIRLVLVDDHEPYRVQIKSIFEGMLGVEVVAEAGDGLTAVGQAGRLEPDLVVMDVMLPKLNGMQATRRILVSHPGIKILAHSMHSDRTLIQAMVEAGAMGYVLKDHAASELPVAVRVVARGETFFGKGVKPGPGGPPGGQDQG